MVPGAYEDSYEEHSHLWDVDDTYIYCNSDEVAPLTEEKCLLLDSIDNYADRFTVHSTQGKLTWGVGLKVGDTVSARLPGLQKEVYAVSIIRSVGVEAENGKRMLFGVEIKEPQYYGRGNSDGVFENEEYFTCGKNCGLFLSVAHLKPLPVLRHQLNPQPPTPPPKRILHPTLPPLVKPAPLPSPPVNPLPPVKRTSPPPLPPHSYVVLEEAPPYSRGALVRLTYNNKYYGHSHLWVRKLTPVSIDKLAPLTSKECALLDAIGPASSDEERYAVYGTTGRLAWGVGLKVGDTVLARLPGEDAQYAKAIIRTLGVKENSARRSLFGVDITDHCYEVSDELYFEGLFLSLAGIKPSLMTSEDSTPLASTASSSLPSPVSTPPHSVALSLRLPHSYMLLRANEMYKRGALMEEDIYDFFGYHGHSHLWDVEESDINVAVTGRKRTLGPNYSV